MNTTTMGTKDKMEMIGKHVLMSVGSLQIEVEIVDYKYIYGRDRWQVTPVSGKGETWIESFKTIKTK